MATPLGTAQHDLGSLRIHEGQRKGSKLGKGLAIFFGGLVILGGHCRRCLRRLEPEAAR